VFGASKGGGKEGETVFHVRFYRNRKRKRYHGKRSKKEKEKTQVNIERLHRLIARKGKKEKIQGERNYA